MSLRIEIERELKGINKGNNSRFYFEKFQIQFYENNKKYLKKETYYELLIIMKNFILSFDFD